MAKIQRYNGNLLAFGINATGTNRTVFGDVTQSDALDDNLNADYRTGWEIVGISEVPTKQDFNALGFTHGQIFAYLHQMGLPEWNINQEYHTGSFAPVSGVIFVSQTDNNTGNDPTTDDGTNWAPLLDNAVTAAVITPAADANVVLTAVESQADVLELVDGAWTTGRDITVPDELRLFWIDNTAGSYDATIKTAAGTSVTVPAGNRRPLYCDGTDVIDLLPTGTVAEAGGLQPIDASVAANALTVTLNPTTLDFRDNSLTSGTINTREVAAAISMTVSSGSTLGTIATQNSRLALLAIDVAGTVELAIVNTDGGINLDETDLISTTAEGGAGGADSANVIYSTTARANVPYRVVGFIDITEAVAGTWATGPTTIQGAGGNAATSMQSLGLQKPQDVTGSRAFGTTYYNETGRPMFLWSRGRTATAAALTLTIDGSTVASIYQSAASTTTTVCGIIPPGSSYAVDWGSGTKTLQSWFEQT